MGNLSPRQSKSYHEGFSYNLTPNPSSWKKQLQFINETINIRKFSLRHTNKKTKQYQITMDENTSLKKIHKNHLDMNVKKSFSLFTIKQPLTDSTNKPDQTKTEQQLSSNSTVIKNSVQHRRRSKNEGTTVPKRHSTYILPKSQSQYYQQYQIQLSSNTKTMTNSHGLSSSTTVTRKTIIQASTSELLRCLSEYLCKTCQHLLPILDPIDCIIWIKSADRQLILQGWQEQVFVNPANIVFVYLIVRDTLTYVIPSTTIKTVSELQSIVLTCLYLAFSYMGNEITYPLKPFVTDNETREVFWQRIVLITGQLSSNMLAINQNPKFFTECFSELKNNLVY